jgi:ATP-dependent Clp protease ATP-binding subunit ClpB
MLAKQEITIDATDHAISYLADAGFDPHYGARPIKRIIQKKLTNALSKEILGQKINKNSVVLIDAFEGQLVFRNQEITV